MPAGREPGPAGVGRGGRRLAGAVLAGGRSRRMGRTKALIEIDGVAMADRVLAALRGVGARPVVVCGGDERELAPLGAPVVADPHPGEGPVGGVLGALGHLGPLADSVAVLACDLGLVDATTLAPLVEAAAGAPGRLVVARTDRLEPMCAIWPSALRGDVAERFRAGERALHRVVAALDPVEVALDPDGLANINAPGDLPR